MGITGAVARNADKRRSRNMADFPFPVAITRRRVQLFVAPISRLCHCFVE